MLPSPDVAGTMRSPRMIIDDVDQQRTPTWRREIDGMPDVLITEWTAEEVGKWISNMGLGQYRDVMVENEITGDALIRLTHEDLKDMEIMSVGHRLTILKAIYNVKVEQDVPFETDDYVPVSAEIDDSKTATQSDIQRLISIIRQRDQRILEHESKILRMSESIEKLRQDMLPYIKMVKEKSPLPPVNSYHHSGSYQRPGMSMEDDMGEQLQVQDPPQPMPPPSSSTLFPPAEKKGLSRKFSMKKLILGTPKSQPSPTFTPPHSEGSSSAMYGDYGNTPTSSAHPSITSSMIGNPGTATTSLPPQIPPFSNFDHPSPTSPGNQLNHHSAYDPHASIPAPSPKPQMSSRERNNATPSIRGPRTPAPVYHDEPPSDHDRTESRMGRARGESSSGGSGGGSNSVEIFKSFRVSMEDPCYKVLPAALKRYNIQADWRQYALYIVHGDQERCLGLEERPLILFKQLDKEGRKPMFMLRRNAGANPTGGGGDLGGPGLQVPGGVL